MRHNVLAVEYAMYCNCNDFLIILILRYPLRQETIQAPFLKHMRTNRVDLIMGGSRNARRIGFGESWPVLANAPGW